MLDTLQRIVVWLVAGLLGLTAGRARYCLNYCPLMMLPRARKTKLPSSRRKLRAKRFLLCLVVVPGALAALIKLLWA